MSDVRGVRRVWCVAVVTCGCVEKGLWSKKLDQVHWSRVGAAPP